LLDSLHPEQSSLPSTTNSKEGDLPVTLGQRQQTEQPITSMSTRTPIQLVSKLKDSL
jgi:hypothetical protein